MGLFGRRDTDDHVHDSRGTVDYRTERAGTSPGLIRALFTLASVAGAGLLIWIAVIAFPQLVRAFKNRNNPEQQAYLAAALSSRIGYAILYLGLAGLLADYVRHLSSQRDLAPNTVRAYSRDISDLLHHASLLGCPRIDDLDHGNPGRHVHFRHRQSVSQPLLRAVASQTDLGSLAQHGRHIGNCDFVFATIATNLIIVRW